MEGENRVWYSVDVPIEEAAHEAVGFGLMEAGALGTETSENQVRGYFAVPPDIKNVRYQIAEALRIFGLSVKLFDLITQEIPDRDWLAEWKKSWQPTEVGRFVIAPPWFASTLGESGTNPAETGTITIHINPGMAFGTGTHETTRLCLKALEKHFRGGSFLDVGTGTGILAIAAAKMFPAARVEACDTDAEAVAIAKKNARLNHVADRINFRIGTVDDSTVSADFVCANLTAPVIVDLLPALVGATCGRLVLSGILDSQEAMVTGRLNEAGVTDLEIGRDGEWVSIVI